MKTPTLFLFLFVCCLSIAFTGCSDNQTTRPERKTIVDAVFASGHITTSDEYLVTSYAEGYLQQSYVQEGDSVTSGMPLFQLSSDVQSANLEIAEANYRDAKRKAQADSPELQQAKLQVEQAQKQLELDRKNLDRYAELVTTEAVSQLEYEKAQLQYESSKKNVEILEKSLADLQYALELNLLNAKNQLDIQRESTHDYILSASTNGQVLNVFKSQGELVRRGEAIAQIGGGETLIKLYIAEEDIDDIALGQEAVISLNTHPDRTYKAIISKIYPAFNEQEQSFIVEAQFSDDLQTLFPGTQLQANIIIQQKEDVLVIPTVYLMEGDTVLNRTGNKIPVKTGIKNTEWVEIMDGIDTTNTIMLKL
ncbi:efflux RND transporter periplasmic adaptor subunit [Halalkalibaculum sp. DA3122]|uniref:efflux RND transporter periplasmic adaptor subunit n=1 Tax=Halalkalibaculum sp. DA3122 TaxID=3373607 RepID=UPI003753FD46